MIDTDHNSFAVYVREIQIVVTFYNLFFHSSI